MRRLFWQINDRNYILWNGSIERYGNRRCDASQNVRVLHGSQTDKNRGDFKRKIISPANQLEQMMSRPVTMRASEWWKLNWKCGQRKQLGKSTKWQCERAAAMERSTESWRLFSDFNRSRRIHHNLIGHKTKRNCLMWAHYETMDGDDDDDDNNDDANDDEDESTKRINRTSTIGNDTKSHNYYSS